jgi:polysaccharide export outer membrane protein
MKAMLKTCALAAWLAIAASPASHAQQQQQSITQTPIVKQTTVKTQTTTTVSGQGATKQSTAAESRSRRVSSDENKADGVPAETQANRLETPSEDAAAIVPYYNNFLSTYRLGPEDVISVTVFGQERYSRGSIVIPPDGVITYPLIPEGIFVAGKTRQQVAQELTKRLDEYIIDPKVTVTLEKAQSAVFSVVGDVAQPGIRPMTRRLSVSEALAAAGGVLPTGDKSKVTILRQQANGPLMQMRVNVKDIEKGKVREMAYLVPGDQIIVPGNKFKTIQKWMSTFTPFLGFARIFGVPIGY